jgi:hypothetical protein
MYFAIALGSVSCSPLRSTRVRRGVPGQPVVVDGGSPALTVNASVAAMRLAASALTDCASPGRAYKAMAAGAMAANPSDQCAARRSEHATCAEVGARRIRSTIRPVYRYSRDAALSATQIEPRTHTQALYDNAKRAPASGHGQDCCSCRAAASNSPSVRHSGMCQTALLLVHPTHGF